MQSLLGLEVLALQAAAMLEVILCLARLLALEAVEGLLVEQVEQVVLAVAVLMVVVVVLAQLVKELTVVVLPHLTLGLVVVEVVLDKLAAMVLVQLAVRVETD